MKVFALAAFAAVAVALPQAPKGKGTGGAGGAPKGQPKQGSTSTELIDGPCKAVTLIFARASTEGGNMVSGVVYV
jgi:hypothetical protein